MTSPLVLVTGASGYLGVEVALSFLEASYRVRGTVRTQAQADRFLDAYPQFSDAQIEFIIVPSIVSPGAFDVAVKGVDFVAHTASPVPQGVVSDNEKEFLIPAIGGTVGILESAKREPKIKAIVLTSSIAAVRNYQNPLPNVQYTSESWNPITFDEARAPSTPPMVTRIKALAEKAAWEFMEREKPGFTLTTILPTWVLGPSREPGLSSLGDLRSSSGMTAGLIVDPRGLPATFNIIKYVHIKDVALAHVGAIARPETRGRRYLLTAGPASVERIAFLLRKSFPEHVGRIAEAEDKEIPSPFEADGTPAEAAFGFKYRGLEETVKNWGEQIFSLQA